MKRETVHILLDELEDARIINFINGSYELKHDSLAQIIFSRISPIEKAVDDFIDIIKSTRASEGTLNDIQISQISSVYDRLVKKLDPDLKTFLDLNIYQNRRSKKIKLRINWTIRIIGFISFFLLFLSIKFINSERSFKLRTLLDYANILKYTDYTKSFRLAEAALEFSDDKSDAENIIINSFNGSNTVHFYNELDLGDSNSKINSVDIHPNDDTIAVGYQDGRVVWWNKTGNVIKKNYPKFSNPIISTSFFPNGSFFVFNDKKDFSLEDLHGDKKYSSKDFLNENFPNVKFHEIINISISPDNNYFLVSNAKETGFEVLIFDISKKRFEKIYEGEKQVYWAKFCSSSSIIIWIDNASIVGLSKIKDSWKVKSNQTISTLNKTSSEINIDTTNKVFLVPSYDKKNDVNKIIAYDCNTFNPRPNLGNEDKKDKRDSLFVDFHSYYADYKNGLLAVGRADNSILLKKIRLGSNYDKILKGHESDVYFVKFSNNGDFIVSASNDQTIKLWDKDGNLLEDLKGHTDYRTKVLFSHSGKYFITTIKDKLRIWNFKQKETSIYSYKKATSADYSSNGEFAIISHSLGISLIDVNRKSTNIIVSSNSSHEPFTYLEFAPNTDSLFLAITGKEYYVYCFDKINKSAKLLSKFKKHQSFVESAHFFQSSNNLCVISSSSCTEKLGNLCKDKTGLGEIFLNYLNSPSKSELILRDRYRAYLCGAINDTLLFSYTQDKLVRFFSKNIPLDTNKTIAMLDRRSFFNLPSGGHLDNINYIEYNSRKKLLLTASKDRNIITWKFPEGKKETTPIKENVFSNHLDEVFKAHFSKDGNFVVSCSDDSYIKIWDSEKNVEKFSIKNFNVPIEVKISTDNKNILILSSNGFCQIKPILLDVDDILKEVKSLKVRELSRDEINYFGIQKDFYYTLSQWFK